MHINNQQEKIHFSNYINCYIIYKNTIIMINNDFIHIMCDYNVDKKLNKETEGIKISGKSTHCIKFVDIAD